MRVENKSKLMRSICISFLLMIAAHGNGQVRLVSVASIDPHPRQITFRCDGKIVTGPVPLLIVDGQVIEIEKIREIKPGTISEVKVLKGAEAAVLYGSQGAYGVIIVKTSSVLKLRILDAFDGSSIPNATVRISRTSGKDTILLLADSNGIAKTSSLDRNGEYKLQVTATGYNDVQFPFNSYARMDSFPVMMLRKYKMGEEAFVYGHNGPGPNCFFTKPGQAADAAGSPLKKPGRIPVIPEIRSFKLDSGEGFGQLWKLRLFPVPITAGQQLHVELIAQEKNNGYLRLMNAAGVNFQSVQVSIVEGSNRFEVQTSKVMPAGIYFLIISGNQQQVLVKQEFVIQ